MKILDLDENLYSEVLKCKDFNELMEKVAKLTDTLICWQKILNDLLQNLDSDNIAEIDFSKVKIIYGKEEGVND